MIRVMLPALAGAALLASCGERQSDAPQQIIATQDVGTRVAAVAAAGEGFLPGEYAIAMRPVTDVRPGVAAHPVVERQMCLAGGTGSADLFANLDDDCVTNRFSMAGGQLDLAMTCAGALGQRESVEIQGRYDPDGYRLTMTSRVDETKAGEMIHIAGDRIGDC